MASITMECLHQDKLNIANGRIEWCKDCGAIEYLDWNSDSSSGEKEWHYPSYGFAKSYEQDMHKKIPRIYKALFFRDIPFIGIFYKQVAYCGKKCCELIVKNKKYVPANRFFLFRLYCKIASIIFRERVCLICGKRVSSGACVEYID